MYRDAGSVRLTEEGTKLVAAARQVIWSGEAFLEEAQRQDLIKERLRLGVTELIACTWLHDFLRAFKQSYPSVNVELQVDLSREIDRSLASGQLDLALQTAPFSTDLCGTIALGKYAYVWVATPEVSQQLGKRATLQDMFANSILTHAKHSKASKELARFAEANDLSQDQIVHSNSLASCVPMAVDGMGIALLPLRIVSDDISKGRLVRLDADWHPSELEVFAQYDETRVPRFVRQAAVLARQISEQDKR